MRVTYRVARVRGEKVHVYPDVYGRAGNFTSAVGAELSPAPAPTPRWTPSPCATPRPRLLPRRHLLRPGDLATKYRSVADLPRRSVA
jgi:hypothetical protein